MAVDTSNINLLDIIPTRLKKAANTDSGEWQGPCPFCGGKDRFRVHPNKEIPDWACRRCGRSGDAVSFLQEYHNMSFVEACQQLGIELKNKGQSNGSCKPFSKREFAKTPGTQIAPAPESVPALDNPAYQERLAAFVDWSWRNLHSGDYPDIARYLGDRGIASYHSDIWMLGYNPRKFNLVWGGIEVYLPEGIVIPYLDAYDNIYKAKVRQMEYNVQPRYLAIKGGANWLFNSHKIKPSSIVVMVEGEIDAMSISIAWNHYQIVPVATGATTGARWLRWPALLATAQKVLVAYDSDEPGNAAAEWWLDVLPNATRLIPEMHDVNDMLCEGYPIRNWILSALHISQEQEPVELKQQSFLEEAHSNHYQHDY